jgi:SOS-response transcriptional repressor LexA
LTKHELSVTFVSPSNTKRINKSQYPTYFSMLHTEKMEKHERLRDARIDAGFNSASDAARSLGIRASTYIHHENGTRDFSDTDALKYGRRFGAAPEWLTFGTGSREFQITDSLAVRGEVRAGAWLEVDGEQETNSSIAVAADHRYRGQRQYALRVVGTSMNKVARPGIYVIVVDWSDNGAEIKEGDLVVVRRERAHTYEVTLKRAKMGKDTWELWPESDDPRHQEPIKLKHHNPDWTVAVIGKVIGKYEPL